MPVDFRSRLEPLMDNGDKVLGWYPSLVCFRKGTTDDMSNGFVITRRKLIFFFKFLWKFEVRAVSRSGILGVSQDGNKVSFRDFNGEWELQTNAKQAAEIMRYLSQSL
jgi:hypothetical protein